MLKCFLVFSLIISCFYCVFLLLILLFENCNRDTYQMHYSHWNVSTAVSTSNVMLSGRIQCTQVHSFCIILYFCFVCLLLAFVRATADLLVLHTISDLFQFTFFLAAFMHFWPFCVGRISWMELHYIWIVCNNDFHFSYKGIFFIYFYIYVCSSLLLLPLLLLGALLFIAVFTFITVIR